MRLSTRSSTARVVASGANDIGRALFGSPFHFLRLSASKFHCPPSGSPSCDISNPVFLRIRR